MSIRILRLGSPRVPHEGLRLGTVRRPPRAVPKSEFARRDYYDVWLPILSPSPDLVTFARSAHDEKAWRSFRRKFASEMKDAASSHLLDLLAALSHQTNFSLGCYCPVEAHCHRSVLRTLLESRGAKIVE